MNTPVKVGGFVLGLLAVFAAAAGVGLALGSGSTSVPATAGTGAEPTATMDHGETGQTAPVPEIPGGLMTSQDGYTMQLAQRNVATGEQPLNFLILGPDGVPVAGYQVAHDKEMHVILVRRDLTGFQHLHPTRAADGTWSVAVDLPMAGDYRVFADFVPTGHDGLTLGADLAVAGDYRPQPLPPPATTVQVGGYTVTLNGQLVAGRDSELTLSVSRDGTPVTDLQPYLAAYGHLVALRAGDLAYLHVHPVGAPGDGVTTAGPDITFYASVPSSGEYRLFLNFQHDGVVRTAEFTAHAHPAEQTSAAADATAASTGHDDDGGH